MKTSLMRKGVFRLLLYEPLASAQDRRVASHFRVMPWDLEAFKKRIGMLMHLNSHGGRAWRDVADKSLYPVLRTW